MSKTKKDVITDAWQEVITNWMLSVFLKAKTLFINSFILIQQSELTFESNKQVLDTMMSSFEYDDFVDLREEQEEKSTVWLFKWNVFKDFRNKNWAFENMNKYVDYINKKDKNKNLENRVKIRMKVWDWLFAKTIRLWDLLKVKKWLFSHSLEIPFGKAIVLETVNWTNIAEFSIKDLYNSYWTSVTKDFITWQEISEENKIWRWDSSRSNYYFKWLLTNKIET